MVFFVKFWGIKILYLVITRDGEKLYLFDHLLRNKIAEIIAKIAQKIAL